MSKNHLKEFGIVVLVFILNVTILGFLLPVDQRPYARIMTAEIKRDYPMYHLLRSGEFDGIKPEESSYPMETMLALNILMRNQMNIDLALSSLSATAGTDGQVTIENEAMIKSKLLEFENQYVSKVRFISIIFLVVVVVLSSSIIFQIIHVFERKKRNAQ
ncbi:MAG: hypothetical protein GX829_04615 [Clostridium sp.]|nr:hypothetical protein [Clostridium sp.]